MTTYLGKSCSFCLPRVPFVNCRQFMYLVISLLVLRAGYGIWLYQFLIIAYLFTLLMMWLIYFVYINICWAALRSVEKPSLKCIRKKLIEKSRECHNHKPQPCHVWSLLLHKNTRQLEIFEDNAPVNLYFLWQKPRRNGTFTECVLKTLIPW